jgi:uncharacterized membrane protein
MSAPAAGARPLDSDAYGCGSGGSYRTVGWVAVAVVAGLIGLVVLASVFRWFPGPPGTPYFWPVFPLGFFLVLILVFVAFRFAFWGRGWGRYGYGWDRPSARQILEERYARGEISLERLQEMSRDLDTVHRD